MQWFILSPLPYVSLVICFPVMFFFVCIHKDLIRHVCTHHDIKTELTAKNVFLCSISWSELHTLCTIQKLINCFRYLQGIILLWPSFHHAFNQIDKKCVCKVLGVCCLEHRMFHIFCPVKCISELFQSFLCQVIYG